MNYIHALRAERDSMAAELAAMREGLRGLLAHVASPKFQGTDCQWISTHDVARLVHDIEAAALDASGQ